MTPDPRDDAIEAEIKEKGLDAPRLTPALIDNVIRAVDFHIFPGSMLTVCCLTLENGFTVTGESACVSPENFNTELGEKIALGKAKDKIWGLEGYLLKQRLFEGKVDGLYHVIDKCGEYPATYPV